MDDSWVLLILRLHIIEERSLDLATANYGGNSVSVLRGNGDGTFQTKLDYGTGSLPYSVTSGDFNGDGKPDLALANSASTSVSVLLNNPAPLISSFTPTSGPVGTSVVITGTGFTGATNVSFNGTTAPTYTVNSDTQITALVPTGATTGTLSVTGVVGTAISSASFSVISFTLAASPVTGSNPQSVASGDFNGDGKQDLAVANYTSKTVSILLGVGDGTFTLKASPTTGAGPLFVAIGDFNGDGKPDLATANSGSNNVTILLGNGDGTFTLKASPATGGFPNSVAVGDFNGDGKQDIATANGSSGTVSILLGVGDGTFTLKSSPATGSGTRFAAIGDFNGDGKPDLAVANQSSSTVSILLGVGDGTFTLKSSPATGSTPILVAIGDFNGDGKPDLATANFGSNNVTILLGNGDGTFTLKSSPATGTNPSCVVVGDFNGDSKPDLATANSGSNNVSVLLYTSAAPPTVTSFSPTSGYVGTSVTITGTNLGSATAVKFNGTSATIATNSATQITTTVPNGATSGTISVTTPGGTAVSAGSFTVTASSTSGALVSQFRLGGPTGTLDEFIELANTTASALNVNGWQIVTSGPTVVVSGTIPAGGHLLLANSGGYSLGTVASGDVTYTGDIPTTSTLVLQNALGTTVDAIGNLSATAAPALATNQYAYLRRIETGAPSNTGTNTTDFNLVSTAATASTVGVTGVGPLTAARLGSPNPHNLASTVQSNAQIANASLNIAGVPALARYASKSSAIDTAGRLSIRRTIKNNTGAAVSKLRFRITAMTGGGSGTAGVADLRAISSGGVKYFVGPTLTQAALGMTIDAPTTPTVVPLTSGATGNGGGLNAGWTAPLPGGTLANGATVNVEFLFGIKTEGKYRIVVDAELLP